MWYVYDMRVSGLDVFLVALMGVILIESTVVLWLVMRWQRKVYLAPPAPPRRVDPHKLIMSQDAVAGSVRAWAASCACGEWQTIRLRYVDAETAYATHVESERAPEASAE